MKDLSSLDYLEPRQTGYYIPSADVFRPHRQVGYELQGKFLLCGIVTTILTVIELSRTDSIALTLSLTPSFVLTLAYVAILCLKHIS